MPGKRLKVFQAHLGFYDTVVAAPSQRAALEAWGAGRVEFAKGFANVTSDPAAVRSALAHPGRVLRRPFGSKSEFKLDADAVPAPKLSLESRRATRERRRKARAAEREAAQRELLEAEREAATARSALKQREAELRREKAAAEAKAREHIARAKARLTKQSPSRRAKSALSLPRFRGKSN